MDILRNDPRRMTGIEQLRAAIAAGIEAPMVLHMGMKVISVETGEVIFEGRPDGTMLNPIGLVHGGYAATMLDSVCGLRLDNVLDAGMAEPLTLELKISDCARFSRSGNGRACRQKQ